MSFITSSKSGTSITSMFLFSCIPVCLLPLLLYTSPPPQHSVLFSFLFPNPISRSSFSFVHSLISPSLLSSSPYLHHHHQSLGSSSSSSSFPKELYSVADIFPASLDKNKFYCFVWSLAKAFVSATAACFLSLSKRTCSSETHTKKKKEKKERQGIGNEGEPRHKQRRGKRCFVMLFFPPFSSHTNKIYMWACT